MFKELDRLKTNTRNIQRKISMQTVDWLKLVNLYDANFCIFVQHIKNSLEYGYCTDKMYTLQH